jgi:Leucine-rich repeat (LRR) protein
VWRIDFNFLIGIDKMGNPQSKGQSRDATAEDKLLAQLESVDANTTRLDLKSRGIHVLPDEIQTLKQLKWLNLPSNHLESLPDAIGELANLATLRLQGNKLSAIPASFAQLSQLITLDLSKNQFKQFSAVLTALPQLTELNLQYNLVEAVRRSSKKRTKN